MKKIIVLLMLLSLYILATPSKVVYIPNTSFNGLGNLHLDVDNYFITSKKGTSLTEIGVSMQVLPFKEIKLELSADYKANLDSPIYLAGKLVLPMKKFPNIALGVFNLGVNSETLKPVYYLLFSYRVSKVGKFLFGGYYGDKGMLRDNDGDVDNKGLLVGYENTINKNLYLGIDYFMGENILSAFSIGMGWRFAKNVKIKVAWHLKLKESMSNLLSFQVNINTF